MEWVFRKIRKKERDSERILFEMFYQRVYDTAYFLVQDCELAQDVVQETFFKAFKHIHKLDHGEKLGAWLATIATNTALDLLRKIKRWNDIPTEDVYIDEELTKAESQSSVEKIVEQKFLKNLLQQEISKLKPHYKQVLILKYEYELKDEEIAEALKINVNTVKSRIHRAKLKLKTTLENRPDIKEGGIF